MRRKLILAVATSVLTLLAIAAWFVRVDGGWCRDCGMRCERATLVELPVGTTEYECRLGLWFARGGADREPCTHAQLRFADSGHLEQLWAYHPLFCNYCSHYND